MSINYAILGLLYNQTLSGYDLKKAFQDLPFMPWSGNNNQIYKALVQLLEQDLVKKEVQHQECAPTKNNYSITDKGKEALYQLGLSTKPEIPEFKKMFLVQLAWTNQLDLEQIDKLLADYEEQLSIQIIMNDEKKRRKRHYPETSEKGNLMWEMLCDNIIMSYQTELEWIKIFRKKLNDIR